ncbi:MAG: PASTA domain-containing protein [Ruminococcus sp.]|uniref:PASTA domain-containing protein n=1 Tax=Ruminococcus sp. TaxID=41978 RepID=UPI0025F09803|nr:PASTA domain-containing protein [Ruminococcus sp.]MBO4866509.1 PASTA domain-containing protein [Ruminococcus sp.]
MMKNRLKNLRDRASDSDADILRDDFADFGKDAQIPDDARERILSSVMGKAGFKMNNTNGVIKGHKNITENKTDSNISASNSKLRIHRGGAIAACIAVLAAGAVSATMLFGKQINTTSPSSSEVNTSQEEDIGSLILPNFVGKNIEQVEIDWGDKLNIETEYEYNLEYEDGIIFWQSQDPGKIVEEGYTITLKVSLGVQTAVIPDVSGKSSEDAEIELREAGFTVVLRSKYDDNVPEGIAICTEPAAGNEFAVEDMVTLYVSKGSSDGKIQVPNVIGMNKESAITFLKDNNLKPVIEDLPNDEDKGMVIDMSVEPGRYVEEDTEIILYVSTGETDPVDLTISLPMPKDLTGEYTVNGYIDGNIRYTKMISDASKVAGSSIQLDVSGKKTERLKVTLKNEATGESIDYAEFVVDYDKKTAELVGELNKDLQYDKNDLVDLTISIPMPEGLSGKYTVNGLVDGKTRYTQAISDAKAVAGGAISMDISGKDTETLTISLTNESTGKSVNYAVFNINYNKKTAELNGAFNKDGLLATMK